MICIERRDQHSAAAVTVRHYPGRHGRASALLARTERGWSVKDRALQGCFVSAVTALEDGTLFAVTRGVGIARSDDGGFRWTWVNEGLSHHEFWLPGPAV